MNEEIKIFCNRDLGDESDPMMTFRDLVEIRLREGLEAVTEASLSHFYQVWVNSGETSFAILTSWREDPLETLTPEAYRDRQDRNNANFQELQHLLRGWGYGFIRTKGGWEGGRPEPSLFVTGITKARAIEVMNRYQQEAVVYGGPETGGRAVLLRRSGEVDDIGPWHLRRGENWTSWKNKDFTFEALAPSWSEALVGQVLAKKSP